MADNYPYKNNLAENTWNKKYNWNNQIKYGNNYNLGDYSGIYGNVKNTNNKPSYGMNDYGDSRDRISGDYNNSGYGSPLDRESGDFNSTASNMNNTVNTTSNLLGIAGNAFGQIGRGGSRLAASIGGGLSSFGKMLGPAGIFSTALGAGLGLVGGLQKMKDTENMNKNLDEMAKSYNKQADEAKNMRMSEYGNQKGDQANFLNLMMSVDDERKMNQLGQSYTQGQRDSRENASRYFGIENTNRAEASKALAAKQSYDGWNVFGDTLKSAIGLGAPAVLQSDYFKSDAQKEAEESAKLLRQEELSGLRQANKYNQLGWNLLNKQYNSLSNNSIYR